MRKGILAAMAALVLLIGCGTQGDKGPGIPVGPKWKGPTYRTSVDAKAPKPNPAGITIPTIDFTANPDALETRATLVIRFDTSGAKKATQPMDQMVIGPFDIHGEQGSLPSDYLDTADTGLARMLGAYCMNGKIKMKVAIARSSLSPQAADSEVTAKLLSDWLPIEVEFKNPHPKC